MKQIDFNSKVPFTEHLSELRVRLVVVASTIMVCSGISFIGRAYLINFLERPLPIGYKTLSFISPTEGFFVAMKVSIFSGIFFAFPIILYQTWQFIVPGLKKKEIKYTVPLVCFGSIFFFIGASFSYFIILPIGLKFLLNFGSKLGFTATITVANYLSFVIKLILGFGAAFQLPLIIAFLCKVEAITTKQLIFYRKYALVCCLIVSAILTPPDVMSQGLMALPLFILYELGIWAGKVIEKKKKEAVNESDPKN